MAPPHPSSDDDSGDDDDVVVLGNNLQDLSPREVIDLIESGHLTAHEIQQVADFAEQHRDDPEWVVVQSAALTAVPSAEHEEFVDQAETQQDWDDSVAAAVDVGLPVLMNEIQQGGTIGEGDLTNAITSQMPAGTSPADQERWRREVLDAIYEKSAEAYDANAAAQNMPQNGEQVVQQTVSMAATPRWFLDAANQLGYTFDVNGRLPEDLQQRFVDYYNSMYGASVDNFDQLVATMEEPTDEAMSLWQSALLGDEPTTAHPIELPGMDPVTLTQQDFDWLMGNYGLSQDGVTRLVRMAYMTRGIDPATGEPRDVDLFGLAAAMNGLGLDPRLADAERRDREIEQLEQRIADVKGSGSPSAQEAAYIARLEGQLRVAKRQALNAQYTQDRGQQYTPGVYGAQQALRNGLDKYDQNQYLAVIHVLDPGLASRIAKTGGDPEKLDPRDNARAWNLLADAGVVGRDSSNGFRPDNAIGSLFDTYFGVGGRYGGGGGGGGTVRRVLDEVAVKQQIDDFWQSMFREKADPALVKQFASSLQKALDKSPQGQDFDATARIQEWLKGQSRYGELYGKKPEGTTEQEWQGSMIAGQESILGSEVPLVGDPAAIGMETGSYQAAVGSAIGTKEAWQNSTWLQRLANAAQTVAANT